MGGGACHGAARHHLNHILSLQPKGPRSSLKDGEAGKDVATIQHLLPEMVSGVGGDGGAGVSPSKEGESRG